MQISELRDGMWIEATEDDDIGYIAKKGERYLVRKVEGDFAVRIGEDEHCLSPLYLGRELRFFKPASVQGLR